MLFRCRRSWTSRRTGRRSGRGATSTPSTRREIGLLPPAAAPPLPAESAATACAVVGNAAAQGAEKKKAPSAARAADEDRAVRHAGEGVQEAGAVQLDGPRRGRRRRAAARLRRVLELRRAQGAAAGAQGGVHPRGALQRVQEGGEVHPRRRRQERVS